MLLLTIYLIPNIILNQLGLLSTFVITLSDGGSARKRTNFLEFRLLDFRIQRWFVTMSSTIGLMPLLAKRLAAREGVHIPTKKRASVALVLRVIGFPPHQYVPSSSSHPTPSSSSSTAQLSAFLHSPAAVGSNVMNTELLFIRRTPRQGDPWSGQVAFPGGKRDPEDTSDVHTAIREAYEECGLDLSPQGGMFECIGRLDDRPVYAGGKIREGFTYCAFVFVQTGPSSPPMKLSVQEVDAVRWVSLNHFNYQHNHIDPTGITRPYLIFPGASLLPPFLQYVFGIDRVHFPAILLPAPPINKNNNNNNNASITTNSSSSRNNGIVSSSTEPWVLPSSSPATVSSLSSSPSGIVHIDTDTTDSPQTRIRPSTTSEQIITSVASELLTTTVPQSISTSPNIFTASSEEAKGVSSLPSVSSSSPSSSSALYEQERNLTIEKFQLWGMTLRATSELLELFGQPSIAWPPMRFNSLFINSWVYAICGYIEVYEVITGKRSLKYINMKHLTFATGSLLVPTLLLSYGMGGYFPSVLTLPVQGASMLLPEWLRTPRL